MAKPKVTESTWKAIKTLLKGGATYKEICEYMNIASSTVSQIKSSETYEEYKHKVYLTSGYYRKKMAAIEAAKQKEEKKKAKEEDEKVVPVVEPQETKTQVVEHRQTIQITATHYMMEELKKANELLTLLSNKLAFVVDELTK